MKREKKVDFIIVGQGLAGSLLAYGLIRKGVKVYVMNLPEENDSSMVAAGLFNPVTGRRFVKTWMADRLFPYLTGYYDDLEKELNANFYNPMPLYRPFLSIKEQNEVISRTEKGDLGKFVDRIVKKKPADTPLSNDYGGIFLNNTGHVNIPILIRSIRDKILGENYVQEEFDEELLDLSDRGLRYKNITADKIIYCNGYHARKSKYFSWLPFSPVKGELIYIKLEESLSFIFNRQIFIIPFEEGLYKVGATYDWENIDSIPTAGAKTYLEEKLKKYICVKFRTVDQQAGIRPATKDRRPLIGMHPEFPVLGIFNGLGSKGVSLAPFFAEIFVDHLLYGKELDNNININRYISLY